jgi:hypothetical protein
VVVLPDLGERQLHALAALGAQVVLGGVRVVAGGERDVEDLLERVTARLPVLELDEVQHLVLAVEHEVVQPHEDRRALGDRHGRPPGLHRAGPARRLRHVLGGAVRHLPQDAAGHRVLHGERRAFARRGHDG